MNPPPLPSKQPSLFANNFVFEPMPDPANPIRALENLLKYPGRIVHELHQTRAAILATWLLIFGIAGVAIYGIVVGAQSGGAQMWIAPAKLGLGRQISTESNMPSPSLAGAIHICAPPDCAPTTIPEIATPMIPKMSSQPARSVACFGGSS